MVDIGQPIWNAWTRQREWSTTFASLTAWTASVLWNLKIDWDSGAGESWMMLYEDGRLVGLLGTDTPALFCLEPYASRPWPYPVVVIGVPSLTEPALSCELETLENSLERPLSLCDLDPSAFSALDLCFCTM